MRISAIPSGAAIPSNQNLVIDLFEQYSDNGHSAVGGAVPHVMGRMGLAPTERAWDFAAIAMAVVAADEGASRLRSPDGWTRQLDLTVSVVDDLFWNGQKELLRKTFSFLTGDIWTFSFVSGGHYPKPPRQANSKSEDHVCLLSGGLDSLIGAIDLVAQGHRPMFVSQVAKGDKQQQFMFAQMISPDSLHLQMNHNAKQPHTSERSQRARSVGFFGFGVLAATSLLSYRSGERVKLVVPENGYISVNVPLTPLRIGSLSTRTTHPTFIAMLQDLFDQAQMRIDIVNPYQLLTKGEMMQKCLDQPKLQQLANYSTSCGRYARSGFRQCGRCVPCIVRRSAFLKWGAPDGTRDYIYSDLSIDDAKHRNFSDVRALAMAVQKVESQGPDKWIGGSMNSIPFIERNQLLDVARRGIVEIGHFLKLHGVL